jgi:hypothetical protein
MPVVIPAQNDDQPIKIIIIVKKRIASWVEGRHEAWGALILLSVFAAVVEVGYARGSSHPPVPFFGVAAYALSIALAALIVGIFLGFLFGIPRTLSSPSAQQRPGGGGKTESGDGSVIVGGGSDGSDSAIGGGPNFGVNTNLEQISDWLTKIMVGVGLTQIGKLPAATKVLADALRPGFGDFAGAGTLGVLIVVFFSVCGFLIGYLWTRIYLTKEFVNTEVAVATSRLAAKVSTMESANVRVAAQLSTVEAQPDKDAIALNMVQKQLEPTKGDGPSDQESLDKALTEGSPALKVQVFYLARKLRKEAKDTDREQKVALRVIPIFQALSACDVTNRYHRTHAQLAYALLDQENSDIAGAIAEIGKAIAIRDDHRATGYWNYEVFRALCRMRLMEKEPTEQGRALRKTQIVADFKRAAREDREYVLQEPKAVEWMNAQGVGVQELRAAGS